MRVKGIAGWPSWRQRFEVHPTDLGFGEEPADDDCDEDVGDDGHHRGRHDDGHHHGQHQWQQNYHSLLGMMTCLYIPGGVSPSLLSPSL